MEQVIMDELWRRAGYSGGQPGNSLYFDVASGPIDARREIKFLFLFV